METYRYFLENSETQEWFAPNFEFATTSHVYQPVKKSQWTKDPLIAFCSWTKQEAQEYRDEFYPEEKYKVTEHLFL